MKYSCIIIEDEPLASNVLSTYIEQIPYLEVKGIFHNALESFKVINEEQIDIAFVDIQLSGCSGLDFAKSINGKPLIVFTTAYSEYAVDAFDIDAIDYLLKPIDFSRFLKAVNKAVSKLNPQSSGQPAFNQKQEDEYLFIKTDHRRVKVYYRDILYIEGMQKYVKIITSSQTHVALLSLTKLIETLPSSSFFRVHKSYIVNTNHIQDYSGNLLTIGNAKIPISKGQKSAFNAYIQEKSV